MTASCPRDSCCGNAFPRILAVAAALALVGAPAYAQAGYTPDSLFIALVANGDALVEYDLTVQDPAAEKVTVKLFGGTISDLIVTDLQDNVVDIEAGSSPDEIVLLPKGAEDIRISYSTPDLVSKDRSIWTFDLDSPVALSLKMPPDSVVIDWGEIDPEVFQVGGQTLLTFKPGRVQVSYIIGFLGTEEQANITIRLAETSIKAAENAYPGIVLEQAKKLLADAVREKEGGRFANAEKLSTQASEQVDITIRDYQAAKTTIDDASAQVEEAGQQGASVGAARQLLAQAGEAFAAGDYLSASDLAREAVDAIGDSQMLLSVFIGAAAAGAVAGAYFILRKRPQAYRPLRPAAGNSQAAERVQPTELAPGTDADAPALEPLQGVPEEKTDSALLARIVHKIIEERQHLRPEDRDVLTFLAEKEGAVFESEVRTKFQLPKTTVWRLIKRLEREDLVEIRKAGGQNLIKLRFEGRQP